MLKKLGFFTLAMVSLTSCQTGQKSVSLDEAKSITANFVEKTVDAPPRGVDDLLETIASYSGAPDRQIQRIVARANAIIDRGLASQPEKYMRALYNRMEARFSLGMGALALEDAREVLPLIKKHNKNFNPDSELSRGAMLSEVSWVELNYGSFQTAVSIVEDVVSKPSPPPWVLSQMTRYLLWQGKLDEAELMKKRTLRSAPWVPQSLHRPLLEAMIERSKGNHEIAEMQFRATRSKLLLITNLDWVHRQLVFNSSRIARSMAQQGRYSEAELVYRNEILRVLEKKNTYRVEEIPVLLIYLSYLFQDAGKFDESLVLLNRAKQILTEISIPKESWINADASEATAIAYFLKRDIDKAREIFDELSRFYSINNPLAYNKWYKPNVNRLLTNVLTGPTVDDLSDISEFHADLTKNLGAKHYNTAEMTALKAAYLARAGDTRTALPLFRQAFKILNSRSRRTANDSESSVLQRIRAIYLMEIYIEALSVELALASGIKKAELVAEIYQIAATARGQTVAEAMSASAVRASFDDPELKELARREQDAQKQIQALWGLFATAISNGTAKEELIPLRDSIDDLRVARAAIFQKLETEFPDYASLINPKVESSERLSKALKSDEAVLSFYFTDNKAFVFLVRNGTPAQFRLADISREQLHQSASRLRAALEPNAETLGDIPEFDMEVAYSLYRVLIEPFAEDLIEISNLYVIPHGDLWQVPLSVLVTEPFDLPDDENILFEAYRDVPWLTRKFAIATLPSELTLINQRSLVRTDEERIQLAAFGDPYFNMAQKTEASQVANATVSVTEAVTSRGVFQSRGIKLSRRAAPVTRSASTANLTDLPRLPDTLAEVNDIALVLNADLTQDIFTGTNATEGNVKSLDLSNRRFIVFATHGLVAGDLDGLSQPALALTSPLVAGGDDDGLLTASEILSLRLNADLVVLSACNTAAADGAGAEAVSGLGAAFFYAGAKTLLVSSWPVETSSARLLTTNLFENLNTDEINTIMQALQKTNIELINDEGFRTKDGEMIFSYSHPIFWAPFMVVGDGGS
jgi:CHAT domain-containing protein